MALKKLAIWAFRTAKPILEHHTLFFTVLGAVIVFSTVLIKDNLSDHIKSRRGAVELQKQIYILQGEHIELGSLIIELEESIDDLSHTLSKKGLPEDLNDLAKGIQKQNRESAENVRRTKASDESTRELLKTMGVDSNSNMFFVFDEGKEIMVRNSMDVRSGALSELVSDIENARLELNNALLIASRTNMKATADDVNQIESALGTAKHKSDKAAIQSTNLMDLAVTDRKMAIDASEDYGRLLETEERICTWIIVGLVIFGSVLGLLSQLAGVEGVKSGG